MPKILIVAVIVMYMENARLFGYKMFATTSFQYDGWIVASIRFCKFAWCWYLM